MIKITAIVPYKELGDLFLDIFEKHNQYISKPDYGGNDYELEAITAATAEEVYALKLDSDVIVARGATAYILRDKEYYIPIVEIPFAANDLIRALFEAKTKYGCTKIGIIGTINMTIGVESLSDIMGMEIRAYVYTNHSEIKDMVAKAAKDGIRVVIGGSYTFIHSEEIGLKTISVKTGEEAVWYAITEAKRVAYISRREQEKSLRFKTILDYAYEGVIAVDTRNIISVFNSSSEKTLGINSQRAIGKDLDDVISSSGFKNLLNKENEYFDEIVNYNDVNLAVNKVPIILKGEKLGTVATFQNITHIQEMEGRIRKKIYTRGHVAKHTFEDIIGESRKIKDVIQIAKRFSVVDSNVLIIGETGTGKELFAQSIHNSSTRSKGPFVAVNCAALPESLLESELFGYVEGAFTGAVKGGKPGLFELAHGGSIFLDEISEISPKLQGRLLRVLQEKEIMRIGHDRIIPVDIRVISATNKDLYNMVEDGEFRQDLYYRLDILKIDLPALRHRKEDVLIIFNSFLKNYCMQFKKDSILLSDEAKEKLESYDWPGNIRELRNVCERLVVLNQGNVVEKEDIEAVLPKRNARSDQSDVSYQNSESNICDSFTNGMRNIERERILAALKVSGYNKAKAAESLEVSRTTLWRRMKDLNIVSNN